MGCVGCLPGTRFLLVVDKAVWMQAAQPPVPLCPPPPLPPSPLPRCTSAFFAGEGARGGRELHTYTRGKQGGELPCHEEERKGGRVEGRKSVKRRRRGVEGEGSVSHPVCATEIETFDLNRQGDTSPHPHPSPPNPPTHPP